MMGPGGHSTKPARSWPVAPLPPAQVRGESRPRVTPASLGACRGVAVTKRWEVPLPGCSRWLASGGQRARAFPEAPQARPAPVGPSGQLLPEGGHGPRGHSASGWARVLGAPGTPAPPRGDGPLLTVGRMVCLRPTTSAQADSVDSLQRGRKTLPGPAPGRLPLTSGWPRLGQAGRAGRLWAGGQARPPGHLRAEGGGPRVGTSGSCPRTGPDPGTWEPLPTGSPGPWCPGWLWTVGGDGSGAGACAEVLLSPKPEGSAD